MASCCSAKHMAKHRTLFSFHQSGFIYLHLYTFKLLGWQDLRQVTGVHSVTWRWDSNCRNIDLLQHLSHLEGNKIIFLLPSQSVILLSSDSKYWALAGQYVHNVFCFWCFTNTFFLPKYGIWWIYSIFKHRTQLLESFYPMVLNQIHWQVFFFLWKYILFLVSQFNNLIEFTILHHTVQFLPCGHLK